MTGIARIVGSTIGGIIVSLVALTVSLPIAAATAAFCEVATTRLDRSR